MSNEINKDQAKQIITELLTVAHKRFKQDIAGENEESLDRVVRQFRAKVARSSWKASQHWCKWNDDGPVLMPDYTRIYYRKGSTEVVLQEFPPQIRLMKLKGSLVSRNSSTENMPEAEYAKTRHFSLALPYVIFIFKFLNGRFNEVRCAFSDRPLKRLEEKPLRPYLSNIDSNLAVCLGASFDHNQIVPNDIAQQSALVLNHFWHSSYSDEWSSHFWAYKSHFQRQDPRLATMDSWQENSTDNPLFVIENVKWLEHTEENFGDIIVKMFDNDKENNELHEDLYNSLVDNFLDDVVKTFSKNIEHIETTVADSTIDQLADNLLKLLHSN
jgi:hypothetical protein